MARVPAAVLDEPVLSACKRHEQSLLKLNLTQTYCAINNANHWRKKMKLMGIDELGLSAHVAG